MELQPYQVEGAAFLSKQSGAMLADEPGLGKTAQAIRACDLVNAKSVLVLCPHIAKVHWAREFRQWQLHKRPIGSEAIGGVRVVNYDLISRDKKLVAELAGQPWDVLILDEAHYLKNWEAKRTKAVYGRLRKRAKHVWALTGTPAPNHAGELWSHLYHLADGFEDYYRFRDKYCKIRHTPFGDQIVGSKNMRDLRARMNGFVLRRKKKDVLSQLPPLRFVVEQVSIYNMSEQDRAAWRQIDQRIGDTHDPGDLVKNLRQAELALATERRMLGMLKIGVAAQYIDNELADNSRKLLVFAVHHDVLDGLTQRLQAYNPVQIDGRTKAADRQAAIDHFQTDPKCRLFIGQITAAGTAITLTASSDVLFVEAAWTPADNYQAACRAHRIGQNEGVLARFLTMPGSMDDLVMRILVRKATELSELFD